MQLGKNKTYQQLDSLFSEYIRKRAISKVGGCERCLTPKFDIQKDNGDIFPAWKQLQCSHFIGRSKKSTRLDEDNCIGICGACHFGFSLTKSTDRPIQHAPQISRIGQNQTCSSNCNPLRTRGPDNACRSQKAESATEQRDLNRKPTIHATHTIKHSLIMSERAEKFCFKPGFTPECMNNR